MNLLLRTCTEMAYCEAAFCEGNIDVLQYTLQKSTRG